MRYWDICPNTCILGLRWGFSFRGIQISRIQNPSSERVRGQKPRLPTNCDCWRPTPAIRAGYDSGVDVLVDRPDNSRLWSCNNPHGAVTLRGPIFLCDACLGHVAVLHASMHA